MHGTVFNVGSANDKGSPSMGWWWRWRKESGRTRAAFSPRWLGYLTILILRCLSEQTYPRKVKTVEETGRLHVVEGRGRNQVEISRKCKEEKEEKWREMSVKRRQKGTVKNVGRRLEREILQTQASWVYVCIYTNAISRSDHCSVLDQPFQRGHSWLDVVKWSKHLPSTWR